MSVKTSTQKPMASSGSIKTKKSASALGAPAQHNQGSRKGKKAWRKNVDIEEIEESMEGLRAEERVTGSILQKKTDEELFQVDVKGDEQVRKTKPKFSTSLLTSAKILAQRSAVPAVLSRPHGSNALKRKILTHEEKGRLLRMGKRPRKGPFNAVMDPTELGSGSAMLEVSEAAKQSGSYDVWGGEESEALNVKHPKTPHPRNFISLPAVPSPHEGTSYNPLVTSHQELLRTAHEVEERRLKEAVRLEEMKTKLDEARKIASVTEVEAVVTGVAPGMKIDAVNDDEELIEDEENVDVKLVKKIPERKTKQERKKAERLRAEKRALAEKLARKRMLASVDAAKSIRKAHGRNLAAQERLRAQRQAEMQEKLRKGMAGQKLGKHKVPEEHVDVQLGDELSESLRQLKPEGNLFRDRFLSMQHRALIEPRVPVLPKRRRIRIKEYEKFAAKRFDREQGQ